MTTHPEASPDFSTLLEKPQEALSIKFVSSASSVEQLPVGPVPEVCVVGRSNVGKSSLLNYIAGQKNLARVSQTPGRTRLLNLFAVKRPPFQIVDLPGYGFAKVSHKEKAGWNSLMSGYFQGREQLKAFLFLFDVRRTPNAEDTQLFSWLADMGIQPVVVVTKAEKIHKSKWIQTRKLLSESFQVSRESILFTSSQAKLGLGDVKAALWGVLTPDPEQETPEVP